MPSRPKLRLTVWSPRPDGMNTVTPPQCSSSRCARWPTNPECNSAFDAVTVGWAAKFTIVAIVSLGEPCRGTARSHPSS